MEKTLVLGPPGAGKTHKLLNIVQEEIMGGVQPIQVMFTTFSKKGATEAASRAAMELGLEEEQLKFWSTIHSLAYHHLGLKQTQVMGKQDWEELGNDLGLSFETTTDWVGGRTLGSQLMGLYEYARSKRVSFESAWEWYARDIEWRDYQSFIHEIEDYKATFDRWDFTDMLEQYLENGSPFPVRIAILDEAQDISLLQWAVVEKMFQNAEHVYAGGEDLQALYSWLGAAQDYFLNMEFDNEIHLDRSFRLPRKIYDVAMEISGRIERGFSKKWTYNGEEGNVDYLGSVESLELGNEPWYLLARSSHLLNEYMNLCRERGIPFLTRDGSSVNVKDVESIRAWESLRNGRTISGTRARTLAEFYPIAIGTGELIDEMQYGWDEVLGFQPEKIWHDALEEISIDKREYYLEILRNGYTLDGEPQVFIGTIHSVKGGEARNVAIRTDLTKSASEAFEAEPDVEHRVFYVGVTRAQQNLFVIYPSTPLFYDL